MKVRTVVIFSARVRVHYFLDLFGRSKPLTRWACILDSFALASFPLSLVLRMCYIHLELKTKPNKQDFLNTLQDVVV